jgi:Mor family transcriptional regulator
MKAEQTLPPELLIEIQKYVQGTLIYIPRLPEKKLGWGHKNGARQLLDERDQAIRSAKATGRTIDQLADEYALSADAIRKILYRRKSASAQGNRNVELAAS